MAGGRKHLVSDLLRSKHYDALRAILVKARKDAKLTQAQLAAKICRSQSFVSELETGVRYLDVIEFIPLTRALGLDPAEVMSKLARVRG